MIEEMIKDIRKVFKSYRNQNKMLKDYRLGVYAIKYNKSVEEIKEIAKDLWKNDYIGE